MTTQDVTALLISRSVGDVLRRAEELATRAALYASMDGIDDVSSIEDRHRACVELLSEIGDLTVDIYQLRANLMKDPPQLRAVDECDIATSLAERGLAGMSDRDLRTLRTADAMSWVRILSMVKKHATESTLPRLLHVPA